MKAIKQAVLKTIDQPNSDALWNLMEKYPYRKPMSVTAWVNCIVINCIPGKLHTGLLETREIKGARNHWVKKVQQDSKVADGFEDQKKKLNLN